MQAINSNCSKRKRNRSQIAVVITLIIAAVFLVTMVFINIFKVSSIKTLTSQTADKTALRIASKIGSISKVYFDALSSQGGVQYDLVNKTAYVSSCDITLEWWGVALLAVIALAGVVLFWLIPYVSVLLTGIGLFVSMTMTTGIMQRFQDMSAYNAIREEALFQAMIGLQSDYVELRNQEDPFTHERTGVFEDLETGKTYDLRDIPGMKKERKVSRFLAWYYTKRFPLVDETVLKAALDEFVNGRLAGELDGIKKFVYIYRDDTDPNDDWDQDKWQIKKLSFKLGGRSSAHWGSFFVTCGDACPSYVIDSTYDTIKLITMDETGALTRAGALDEIGFTGKKPIGIPGGLLMELQVSYPFTLIFCDLTCPTTLGLNPIVRDSEWDAVREDMRLVMVRIKEVLNLPETERLRGLTQWFTPFYDPSAHNPDRTSKYTTGTFDENNSYDIYLRINRDRAYIQKWLVGLDGLGGLTAFDNNTIIPPIGQNYDGSSCKQGGGAVTAGCYTGVDTCCETCCNDTSCWCCGSQCAYWAEARWAGTYGTCYKDNTHNQNPVCQAAYGDFYRAIPLWCTAYKPETGCITYTASGCGCAGSCSRSCPSLPGETFSNTLPTEYYYQGQLSSRPWGGYGQYDWNAGPTEVGQAIAILETWDAALLDLQNTIRKFQEKIEGLQSVESQALRNEITYAWKDPPGSYTTNLQYLHIATVRIENYPVSLPYISEKTDFGIDWIFVCKTRTLHDYKGSFKVVVSRYDQDQPNQFWNLRRRKQPLNAEFPTNLFMDIFNEVHYYGRVTTGDATSGPLASLNKILTDYAITSKCKVQYGPERLDIAIINVDDGVGMPSGP